MIAQLLDPVFFVAFMPRHNRHPCHLWILQLVCHGSEFQIGSVVVAMVVVTFEKEKKRVEKGDVEVLDVWLIWLMVVSTLCIFIDNVYMYIFL